MVTRRRTWRRLAAAFGIRPYGLSDYYHVEWERANALTAIREDVDHWYGMVLDLISPHGGHVTACWRYEQVEDATAVGIYTTDSDDPVAGLRCYPLHQDLSGQDEWGHYKDWWYVTYRDGTTRFLIGAVHALDRAVHVLGAKHAGTSHGAANLMTADEGWSGPRRGRASGRRASSIRVCN